MNLFLLTLLLPFQNTSFGKSMTYEEKQGTKKIKHLRKSLTLEDGVGERVNCTIIDDYTVNCEGHFYHDLGREVNNLPRHINPKLDDCDECINTHSEN